MTVYFVGAGPGDPKLITVRGQEILRRANVCIWAGSLVNPALLQELPPGAEVHDSAELNLDEIIRIMSEAHARDLDVVRLHTGDPCLYGAIREQQRRLDDAAIPWEVVPGVSSFQGAAAVLGAELTVPELCQSVVLTRVGGRTKVSSAESLEAYARTSATLCLFLSADVIDEISEQLRPILGSDCPAAVVYRATWEDQIVVRGTLATIAEQVHSAGIRRQAMIVIGRALANASVPDSRLYAKEFAHGYRA
ncbi:MAG: precorrin-4 C(11)-methyltransferase [Polyangiaceae bacterium]